MTTNAQKVYADLVSLGLPAGAATGVVGNLVAESGVNPRISQKGGPGRGIAQWSAGGRWDKLISWARDRKADPLALDTQEAFMVKEMSDSGVWSQLQRTTDTGTAAALVMRRFELPADQSDQNGARRAQLGKDAVAGKRGLSVSDLLPQNGIPIVWDALTGAAGSAVDTATGAVAGAASSAAGAAVAAAEPIAIRVTFVLAGVAIIAGGIYILARPQVKQAQQKAEQALPAAAMAAL